MSDNTLISYEPASGEELWRGTLGDVDAAVSAARRAWPAWAAQPLTNRIEVLRAFSNEVRRQAEPLAELIAREAGKPLWESRTEIDAVVNKVDTSVQAYAERTGKKKFDAGLNASAAVRHKPHGVMAVLGPYNFP
ncbi:MAG: aldehyde dehydrogenase family protein, partial [Erythrobacter sp.]|nr:aldehyde dehydrogenase family protein [Erythrobacter sp.]